MYFHIKSTILDKLKFKKQKKLRLYINNIISFLRYYLKM